MMSRKVLALLPGVIAVASARAGDECVSTAPTLVSDDWCRDADCAPAYIITGFCSDGTTPTGLGPLPTNGPTTTRAPLDPSFTCKSVSDVPHYWCEDVGCAQEFIDNDICAFVDPTQTNAPTTQGPTVPPATFGPLDPTATCRSLKGYVSHEWCQSQNCAYTWIEQGICAPVAPQQDECDATCIGDLIGVLGDLELKRQYLQHLQYLLGHSIADARLNDQRVGALRAKHHYLKQVLADLEYVIEALFDALLLDGFVQTSFDAAVSALHGAIEQVDICLQGRRTIDGFCNNLKNFHVGAAETPLRRAVPSDYEDGVSALPIRDNTNVRAISNAVSNQPSSMLNTLGATDYLWQWGQFLDHDLSLTEEDPSFESADIAQPPGETVFGAPFGFHRSHFLHGSSPRQQVNAITSWIDASNVYGSDEARLEGLRVAGSCSLKTDGSNMLPFNVDGFPNAGGNAGFFFFAGDVRANEQTGLAAMHTLFVREHNRLCVELADGSSADEQFERARRIVGGLMQKITYDEFLPALFGEPLPAYVDYDDSVDASITNIFSTGVYRFGHSALSPSLHRVGLSDLNLVDAFFNPDHIDEAAELDAMLAGLAGQECQAIDQFLVDEVRNMLFESPGSPGTGLDLASLNIQRGRDHGLPAYNDVREGLGLPRRASYAEMTSDPVVIASLETAYGVNGIDLVDLWVGGLCETPVGMGHVGETNKEVMLQQFLALRDGDRFWYEIFLYGPELAIVEGSSLASVINRNSAAAVQPNAFQI